ncbi:hypothetical protein [Aeromonas media]|uniref:hypothetical protein n=1 Tax=Aeromonas media TaxID=651 RepID=UPI003CFCE8BC
MKAIVAISQVKSSELGGNSGAVALPTLAITDSFTVSLHCGNGSVKRGSQGITFSSRDRLAT